LFNGFTNKLGDVYAYVVKDHMQLNPLQYYLTAG